MLNETTIMQENAANMEEPVYINVSANACHRKSFIGKSVAKQGKTKEMTRVK